ncbi:MAG TPA: 16S rRNA (uracil(1498)-N(3))-methyltransferase, partial [Steroidobacteraceae bacterium]
MRLTRVYVDAPLAAGTRITLEGGAARHLTRVLRLRVGEALTLFNGSGGEYAASIEQSQGGRVAVAIDGQRAIERESPLALTLAQGVSRGERMDLVVQKATELGVSGLVPVLTERSVVRLTAQQAERRLNHWRAIAVAACEQSGRNRLPAIAAPVPLKDFLRSGTDGTRLLLSPGAAATLAEVARPVTAVTV